ncbi:hypothetical protein [Sphingobacterium sp. LRF_L2]|uniref:hypothetical protein n=1 Tax=Sphingobacterium sp. LRF_L2 TaxID=3369421 RepID=UPI003F60A2D6
MSKFNYDEAAAEVAKIIDITIESFREMTPDYYTEEYLNHVIKNKLSYRELALYPKPGYRTKASLRYVKNDVLIFFQEGEGPTVEYFWAKIKEARIPLIRESRNIEKIMKRGKIKNEFEYDFVIDGYTSFLEMDSISEQDIDKLNEMIGKFEMSRKS